MVAQEEAAGWPAWVTREGGNNSQEEEEKEKIKTIIFENDTDKNTSSGAQKLINLEKDYRRELDSKRERLQELRVRSQSERQGCDTGNHRETEGGKQNLRQLSQPLPPRPKVVAATRQASQPLPEREEHISHRTDVSYMTNYQWLMRYHSNDVIIGKSILLLF